MEFNSAPLIQLSLLLKVHFTWWPGKTQKSYPTKKRMEQSTFMIFLKAILKGRSSWFNVLVVRILRRSLVPKDMLPLSGVKTCLTKAERATMENILFSMHKSLEEETDSLFRFSIIRSMMLHGYQIVRISLWLLVCSLLLPLCTIRTVNLYLNLVNDSATLSEFALSTSFAWLVGLETLQER